MYFMWSQQRVKISVLPPSSKFSVITVFVERTQQDDQLNIGFQAVLLSSTVCCVAQIKLMFISM